MKKVLFAALLIFISITAQADTIFLKNGRQIKTGPTWKEGNQVKCSRFGTVVGYPMESIDHVEVDGIGITGSGSGLVAHYRFDGNADDSSGHGNHGRVHGANSSVALTADRFGAPNCALKFDGNSGYIEIPYSNSLDVAGAITLSAWVNFSRPLGGPQHYVIDSRDGKGGYGFNVDTNSIQFWVGGKHKNFSANIHAGKWHHIVGTYDGRHMNLFNDGYLVDSIPFATTVTSSAGSIYIGQRFNHKERFQGIIDDVRIYNRVLYEDEIKQLYGDSVQSANTSNSQGNFHAKQDPSGINPVRAQATHISKIKTLYLKLLEFKDNPNFHRMGFAPGSPYKKWFEQVQALQNDKKLNLQLVKEKGIVSGDLLQLGMEFMSSKGSDTDYSIFMTGNMKKALFN